ncbi:methylated-DNA--[protein]-cysteine S-methyltransferase [Arcanobacterium hippocoleae]
MPELFSRTVKTPIGTLNILATYCAIVSINLPNSNFFTATYRDTPLLKECRIQIHEYFTGQRKKFSLPLAIHPDSFIHRAQIALANIPYGKTISYTELARIAGNSRASRAAGTACAANPLPILLPCHRVIHANGTLGNYRGGSEIKLQLLELEKHHCKNTFPSKNRGNSP